MADEKKSEETKPEVKEIPTEEGTGSLDAFLAPTPSPEVKPPEGEKKEEEKAPDKDEGKKPDEKLPETVKADEKKPSTDDEKKADEPEKKEDKPTEPPKVDFESDDNPYKKRFKDTSNWATDLTKKQLSQDREILILQKKVEGTYDEERDNPKETPEQIEARATQAGRTQASHEHAIATWGADAVEKDLIKFNEIFKDDRFMLGSVASADQPVVEAIRALRRYEFHTEFGDDPTEIIKKVGEKAVKAAGETIKSDETKKLADRVKAADGEAKGLAGLTAKGTETPKDTAKVKPLSEEFDN